MELTRVSARLHLPSGQVTFLFTDIEGSTRLAQMLGAGYRPVLAAHRQLLYGALSSSGGTLLSTEGDSFFVAFDDAAAALAACADAQRVLAAHEWPSPQARPLVRMGLHTGYAEPHDGEYASPEVHRAARVAAAAHGGQILCSAATARSARASLPEGAWLLDVGLHRLRGFDDRERLYQLVAPGLERTFPRPRTLSPAAHNLPSGITSFVGRWEERAALAELIGQHRLTTVVGAGGAGKTRLAIEVARDLADGYPDGVWFVDLAAATDPGLVAVEVAAVLGLRPEPARPVLDTIAEYAAHRAFLLLLDTCDAQLAAAAAVATTVLSAAEQARVLATSREPLGTPGEMVWRIPGMSLQPGIDGGPSDAVALLLERTAAARGGDRAGADEIVDLQRVASRLDGLPLVLELAAARLRVLSASQLAERIDTELPDGSGDVLGTLDAGTESTADNSESPTIAFSALRHTTLQATMAWSYRTLGQRAARLLRRMSVFAGPVDLAALQWLLDEVPASAGLPSDVLGPLAVLVDKSLVQVEPTGAGNTYRMLDPIRAYAARRLVEAEEERAIRDRYVEWALHALGGARLDPDGRPMTLSLYALDPLAVELRSALRWTVTGGSARQGLRLAGGLDPWWRERGLAREGRLWLFRLYARMAETGEKVPDAELASAYHMHSRHAGADGEFAEELRFSQRAEAIAGQAGDLGLLARVLAGRGAPLLDMGHIEQAERVCRGVIDWAQAQGVGGDAIYAVYTLAQLLWQRGALDEAAELLGAARPVEAAQPSERGRRSVDMLLGIVALTRGDLVAAHDHLTVALRSRIGYGFHSRACESISAMAVRCTVGGDPLTGARLFGAADAARSRLHSSSGIFAAYWAQQQAAARAMIGDAAFDAAYAQGAALGLEEAAAVALAVEHPDLAANSQRFSGTPSAA